MAATVCAEPSCPAVTIRNGRCGRHQRKRPSSTQLGYGYWYQRKRPAFLATHPTCQMCGRRPATTVHHTRHDAASEQGLDTRYWQAACVHCNASDGARFRNAGGRPPGRRSRYWAQASGGKLSAYAVCLYARGAAPSGPRRREHQRQRAAARHTRGRRSTAGAPATATSPARSPMRSEVIEPRASMKPARTRHCRRPSC